MSAPPLTGRETIRAEARAYDIIDLRGAEFRRLLALAYSEGLLDELLQDIVPHHSQAGVHRHAQDISEHPKELEDRSTESPWRCPDCPHNAYGLPSRKSWFQRVSSYFPLWWLRQ